MTSEAAILPVWNIVRIDECCREYIVFLVCPPGGPDIGLAFPKLGQPGAEWSHQISLEVLRDSGMPKDVVRRIEASLTNGCRPEAAA